jgi:hypothetical protein
MTHKHKAEVYIEGALAIALVFLSATRAFSDPSPSAQQITAAVKACVEAVNTQELKKNPQGTYHFDAYYNAATGSIDNNLAQLGYVPQRAYLFEFGKCMAEHGFPLGSKDGATDAAR